MDQKSEKDEKKSEDQRLGLMALLKVPHSSIEDESANDDCLDCCEWRETSCHWQNKWCNYNAKNLNDINLESNSRKNKSLKLKLDNAQV